MQKISKSIISLILAISLFLSFSLTSLAVICDKNIIISDDRQDGIYTYCFDKDGATITAIAGEVKGEIVIPSVIGEKNVIGIGDFLFLNNTEITGVVFPETLKEIGARAFEGCTAIKSIVIPDGVTRIQGEAFKGCTALKSVKLPSSLSSIEYSLFENCSSLDEISIPDNVTSLSNGSFNNTEIYNCEENWEDGVLYIGNFLYAAKNTVSGKYIVKEGTKNINIRAFERNSSITEIILPEGVETIGAYAFYECSALEKINIPESVKVIDIFAFYGTKIKQVIIPNRKATVSGGVFGNCKELSSVTLPSELTEISTELFQGCEKLESIIIPASVNDIGADAFKDTAYRECVMKENGGALYVNNILCEIDNKLTGEYRVKEGTVLIGENAFMNCTKITSVYLPETVKEIERQAFSGCQSLVEFTCPESLEKISSYAFSNCSNLETINVSKGVKEIESGAFYMPNLKNLNIDKDNPVYFAENLILFSKDKKELIKCYDQNLTSYNVPDTVKNIRAGALAIEKLKNISLPDGIEVIEEEAFLFSEFYRNKENWENDMLYIGNYLIDSDAKDKASVRPGTVLIADKAFAENYMLTELTIPKTVKYIGVHSFSGSINLKKITVLSPDAVYCCHAFDTKANLEIHGYDGSTTEEYCKENYRKFYSLGCFNGLIVKDRSLVNDRTDDIVLISEEMNVQAFCEAVNSIVEITDKNGNKLADNDIITSGNIVSVKDKNNKTVAKKEIAIVGDIVADGKITAADARIVLRASVELEKLTDVQRVVANIDAQDMNITAADARIILRASVALEDIKEILKRI